MLPSTGRRRSSGYNRNDAIRAAVPVVEPAVLNLDVPIADIVWSAQSFHAEACDRRRRDAPLFVVSGTLKIIGWIATAVLATAVAGMIATSMPL